MADVNTTIANSALAIANRVLRRIAGGISPKEEENKEDDKNDYSPSFTSDDVL